MMAMSFLTSSGGHSRCCVDWSSALCSSDPNFSDVSARLGLEQLARPAPVLQVRELLQAQPRRHVGEIVLDPRTLDVARAVRSEERRVGEERRDPCAGEGEKAQLRRLARSFL